MACVTPIVNKAGKQTGWKFRCVVGRDDKHEQQVNTYKQQKEK